MSTLKQQEDAYFKGDYLSIFRVPYKLAWSQFLLEAACRGSHIKLVKLLLKKGHNGGVSEEGLVGASFAGSIELMEIMIATGAQEFDWALKAAYEGNHPAAIEFLEERGASDHHLALEGACEGGHYDLAMKCFRPTDIRLARAFEAAVTGRNIKLINFFINLDVSTLRHAERYPVPELGVDNWNGGLNIAAQYGDKYIFDLMTQKGAIDFNGALRSACMYNQLEIVDLLISKRVDDWNEGLIGACYGPYRHLMDLMISKGADDWERCLDSACGNGNLPLAREMIDRCITDLTSRWPTLDLNNYMYEACGMGNTHIVQLLIDHGATECECGKLISEHPVEYKVTGDRR